MENMNPMNSEEMSLEVWREESNIDEVDFNARHVSALCDTQGKIYSGHDFDLQVGMILDTEANLSQGYLITCSWSPFAGEPAHPIVLRTGFTGDQGKSQSPLIIFLLDYTRRNLLGFVSSHLRGLFRIIQLEEENKSLYAGNLDLWFQVPSLLKNK